MKNILLKIIYFYQKVLASLIRKFLKNFGLLTDNSCVFYPTCSEYMKQSITKYGVLKGGIKGIYRILRCHPWQKNHFDPLK